MFIQCSAFLCPRAQPTRSSIFLVSNESHILSCKYNQISASNSLYFGCYSWKYTHFQYSNFDFLMYFHNSPILCVTFLKVCIEGKKLLRRNLERKKIVQNVSQVSSLISSAHAHLKIPPSSFAIKCRIQKFLFMDQYILKYVFKKQ